MTPTTYAALAEAVEHGLYRGWDRVHTRVRQPSKRQLLDGLLSAIMVDLDQLIRQCETEEPRNE